MQRIFCIVIFLGLISCQEKKPAAVEVTETPAASVWTAEKANDWYARQAWIAGANFIPSTAINQLEMWQADTFDPAAIDRTVQSDEFSWSADSAGGADAGKTIASDERDPAAIEKSKIEASVETASITSNVKGFAEELAGDKFLKSREFPQASFVSTAFKPTDKMRGKVEGQFTLMGKTKPVTFDVSLVGAGKGFGGKPRIGVTAVSTCHTCSDHGKTYSRACANGSPSCSSWKKRDRRKSPSSNGSTSSSCIPSACRRGIPDHSSITGFHSVTRNERSMATRPSALAATSDAAKARSAFSCNSRARNSVTS